MGVNGLCCVNDARKLYWRYLYDTYMSHYTAIRHTSCLKTVLYFCKRTVLKKYCLIKTSTQKSMGEICTCTYS